MDITKLTLLVAALLPGTHSFALTVEGSDALPVEIKPDASTGLDAVIVLPQTQGVRLVHTAPTSASKAAWYRFSRMGGAYAEEVPFSTDGARSWITLTPDDMGYIVEEDGRRTCVWVVNYANHELYLGSLSAAPEQECGSALLEFSGAAGEISYYTINGRRMELSRDLNLEYTTLAFDEANFTFSPSTAVETVPHIGATVAVTAPLCDTSFRLSGDRFLEKWNRGQSIVSPSFQTRSINIRTRATQTARDNDNEQRPETEGLGGSAPCEIEFEAAVSDAAVFTEWQISRTPDFDILENSYNELTLTYTFRENGNTYVRFVANNADGTCEQVSDVYTVFVGESRLEIPNAFSPEGSPGINDEWKVSYRSLVSYRCHIFNRWGKELFSSTDPAVGWNGKIGNKTVPAGVYFYVIEAVGSDGIRYKRSGDINVINYTSESQPAE